jgi:hypothetical protein
MDEKETDSNTNMVNEIDRGMLILNQLYSDRNRCQERLHKLDQKIELINKNPIIKEFLKLS